MGSVSIYCYVLHQALRSNGSKISKHHQPKTLAPKRSSQSRKIKTVSWQEDTNIKDNKHATGQKKRWLVEGVCTLIQTDAIRNCLRLNLLVDDDRLWYMTASSAKEDDHQQDFISLDDFLWRLPKNQLTRAGHLILMANAFLHLQAEPTRIRDWSKAKICLPKANDQETLNTARSYLCAQCIPYNEL